jgi:hypothetical protein
MRSPTGARQTIAIEHSAELRRAARSETDASYAIVNGLRLEGLGLGSFLGWMRGCFCLLWLVGDDSWREL